MNTADDRASALATTIAEEFHRRVRDEYVPRIGRCVELLSHEQLWHRPGRHNNSVANLLLHLAGNVRQWILCGVDGADDSRDRDGEFAVSAADNNATGTELMTALTDTVTAATAIVDRLGPEQFLAVRRFQSKWDETCLAAVLHVMEHFSGHAGQIYAATKQTLDIDLKFYDL